MPLSSSISRLQNDGTISGTACGSRISRSRCHGVKLSAMPASRCETATEFSAPRTISAPYAPYDRPSASTAAHMGTSCQPMSGGTTKNSQNIRTSAEVPRKISV